MPLFSKDRLSQLDVSLRTKFEPLAKQTALDLRDLPQYEGQFKTISVRKLLRMPTILPKYLAIAQEVILEQTLREKTTGEKPSNLKNPQEVQHFLTAVNAKYRDTYQIDPLFGGNLSNQKAYPKSKKELTEMVDSKACQQFLKIIENQPAATEAHKRTVTKSIQIASDFYRNELLKQLTALLPSIDPTLQNQAKTIMALLHKGKNTELNLDILKMALETINLCPGKGALLRFHVQDNDLFAWHRQATLGESKSTSPRLSSANPTCSQASSTTSTPISGKTSKSPLLTSLAVNDIFTPKVTVPSAATPANAAKTSAVATNAVRLKFANTGTSCYFNATFSFFLNAYGPDLIKHFETLHQQTQNPQEEEVLSRLIFLAKNARHDYVVQRSEMRSLFDEMKKLEAFANWNFDVQQDSNEFMTRFFDTFKLDDIVLSKPPIYFQEVQNFRNQSGALITCDHQHVPRPISNPIALISNMESNTPLQFYFDQLLTSKAYFARDSQSVGALGLSQRLVADTSKMDSLCLQLGPHTTVRDADGVAHPKKIMQKNIDLNEQTQVIVQDSKTSRFYRVTLQVQGAVCHLGGTGGGHYVNYMRDANNRWERHSDATITPDAKVGPENNLQPTMLFFKVVDKVAVHTEAT